MSYKTDELRELIIDGLLKASPRLAIASRGNLILFTYKNVNYRVKIIQPRRQYAGTKQSPSGSN